MGYGFRQFGEENSETRFSSHPDKETDNRKIIGLFFFCTYRKAEGSPKSARSPKQQKSILRSVKCSFVVYEMMFSISI